MLVGIEGKAEASRTLNGFGTMQLPVREYAESPQRPEPGAARDAVADLLLFEMFNGELEIFGERPDMPAGPGENLRDISGGKPRTTRFPLGPARDAKARKEPCRVSIGTQRMKEESVSVRSPCGLPSANRPVGSFLLRRLRDR